ncbi:transglycosylase SLT domain-containing protein [Robbsia andropogonis]|uniref:lytic transglycosylase domain-containing protein n=2 Tax=Robbsia andropogonis TaxID=28092 RepID=UPI0009DF08CC|nr:transglycosylase SLT domain-containing protein [Robbsia andropogonis]
MFSTKAMRCHPKVARLAIWVACVCGATAAGIVSARADCIDDAAAFQHVNVSLMRAIAQVETGTHTRVISTNSNGSYDIGLMQINSAWLPALARQGISEQSLFDPCTNAYVAAWILSENIHRFGPTWVAIGAYNASSPSKQLAYAQKVVDAAHSIISPPSSPMPILPPSYTPPQSYNPFETLQVDRIRFAKSPEIAADANAAASGTTPDMKSMTVAPGKYHFGWTITGTPDVRPVQVFDDGTQTFVQLQDLAHAPAIFADTPQGRILLSWKRHPPYAVIDSLQAHLVFQLGSAQAKAERTAVIPSNVAASTQPFSQQESNVTKGNTPDAVAQGVTSAKQTSVAGALWFATVGPQGTSHQASGAARAARANDQPAETTRDLSTEPMTSATTTSAMSSSRAASHPTAAANADSALWYVEPLSKP